MSAAAFIEARDFLLAHREDYERAYREFRWPVLDRFNWALDYFDPMAARQRPARPVDRRRGRRRDEAQLCRDSPSGRAGSPTICAGSGSGAATACC